MVFSTPLVNYPAVKSCWIYKGLRLGWAENWMWLTSLSQAEMKPVSSASIDRIREFQAGRHCARAVLATWGQDNTSLLVQPDRQPAWPSGFVGSISHSASECIVVVGKASHYMGVGIDIEPHRALCKNVIRMITTACERRWLEGVEGDQHNRLARLLFSAKESFFKCFYSAFGIKLGFRDVSFTLDPVSQILRYQYKISQILPPNYDRLRGRYWLGRNHFITLFFIPANNGTANR